MAATQRLIPDPPNTADTEARKLLRLRANGHPSRPLSGPSNGAVGARIAGTKQSGTRLTGGRA